MISRAQILVNILHCFSLNSTNQHFPIQADMVFHNTGKDVKKSPSSSWIKSRNKVAEDVRCLAEGWRWTKGGGEAGPSTSCHLALICKTPDINWVVSIHPCKSPFHLSFSGPQKPGLHGPHQPSGFHLGLANGRQPQEIWEQVRKVRVFIPCSLLWGHRLAVVVLLYQRPQFPSGSSLLKLPHSSYSL